MSDSENRSLQDLYADADHWHVNTGGQTIHAKRMSGRFRTYKWIAASSWLPYLLLPYLRWDGRQAILLDIPHRQFHLFSLTIWPQDIWMLSLVLILLAMSLFGATAIVGRIWCGYYCFQTVWTDIFTWIEEKIEGNPVQRRKLDEVPWSFRKIRLKVIKHSLWLVISVITGVTFAAYFTDAFELWRNYLTLNVPMVGWVVLAAFVIGTYVFAGFMREQVCFWLCPYARIQSVMVDKDTLLPTYDEGRGEPRGKLSKGSSGQGDCINCRLCVGVCPTGVDIREGLQEGCITCGLCIDACDSIMDKIHRPRGLIRYSSNKEMAGVIAPPLYKRPRVIAYSTIFLLSVAGISYGLKHIPPVEFTVVHERQPLYIRLSNGNIENKYTLKALNKTPQDLPVKLKVISKKGIRVVGREDKALVLKSGKMIPFHVFLQAPPGMLSTQETGVKFVLETKWLPSIRVEYESMFVRPGSQ